MERVMGGGWWVVDYLNIRRDEDEDEEDGMGLGYHKTIREKGRLGSHSIEKSCGDAFEEARMHSIRIFLVNLISNGGFFTY